MTVPSPSPDTDSARDRRTDRSCGSWTADLVVSTQRLPARSIRRTTTHDCTRPDGLHGAVVAAAHGRDLVTDADGHARVLGTARLDARADYGTGRILAVTADPPHPGLASLAGTRAFAGFRRLVEAAIPGEREARTVRFQLMDDLPAALLVNGRALRAAGLSITGRRSAATRSVDICAGWVTAGTLLSGLTNAGPPFSPGPVIPEGEPADDGRAWHETDPLPPHATRRRRLLDVWEDSGLARVQCFFRDSHTDADGTETIVHEYTIRAAVDPATLRLVFCEAEAGALPYPECPSAAASAGRLVGMPVDGPRRRLRGALTGPMTCTHLTNALRSLEDVDWLLEILTRA